MSYFYNHNSFGQSFKKSYLFLLAFTLSSLLVTMEAFAAKPKNELKCMALNLYFEARGESEKGQIGVGMVTLNRSRSRQFGPTICKVVYARGQFSWTFDPYSDVPKAGKVWDNMMQLSQGLINGEYNDPTGNASHYYNPRQASPNWARVYKRTAVIGNHNFHRMPGFGPARSKEELALLEDGAIWSMQGMFGFNIEDDEENIEMAAQANPIFDTEAEFNSYVESLPDLSTTMD